MSRIIIITPPPPPTGAQARLAEQFDVQAVDSTGHSLTNAEKARVLRAAADAVEALGDVGQNVRDEQAANAAKADDKTAGKTK